jgi:hypothetical protein
VINGYVILQPGSGLDVDTLMALPEDVRNTLFGTLPRDVQDAYGDAEKERLAEKAEAEAKESIKANLRRFDEARDEVRREREEAEIGGKLTADAETFLNLRLKPGLTEAHDFQPKVQVPIVQGLFNRDSLSWVAGPSGTFKSFVTADLAFRYGSEDMDYYGRKMTHGRALIVVAEGAAGYAHRKTAWERQYGRTVENVTIYPAPLQLGDTLKEMPALIHHLRTEEEAGRGYGLIIFDTQAMCTVGVDENKSEMNLVINVLHRLRQVSGACVLTVHHFGKNERSGMRGSSMLYAAADTVCILKRKDDAVEVTLSTAQSDEGKQKDTGGEKDFLTLEMTSHPVGEDYFGDTVFSLCPVPGVTPHGPEDGDEAAEAAPDALDTVHLTDRQFYYLRELSAYREQGTSPSDFAKDVYGEDGTPPKDGHRVTRQTARKVFVQVLMERGLVQMVPKSTSRWMVTPLGAAYIMRRLKDDQKTAEAWTRRASRKHDRKVGSEEGSETLPNPSPEPKRTQANPKGEPSSDLRRTQANPNRP